MFHHCGPMTRLRLSLQWVLRGSVPHLHRYCDEAPTPDTRRRRCLYRSRRVTTFAPLAVFVSLINSSLPRRACAAHRGPGAWLWRRLLPASSRGSIRSPKFLGEPRCEHAPLCDPGPVTPNRFQRATSAFHLGQGVGFQATCRISGLYDAACSLAVYASLGGSPLKTQHSLPAGHHPLLERIRTYRVLYERFPTLFKLSLSHRLPPFRGFLAHGRSRLQRES